MVEYVLFDVAGTLLGKPSLYTNIQKVLKDNNYNLSLAEITNKHKLLSEVIHFPDKTNEIFYNNFNAELLYLLGILPTESLLKNIFKSCTYLPWQKFEDTDFLSEINIPMGIISNFNTTLKEKLNSFFGNIFNHIFVSEELGVAKPSIEMYNIACSKIDIPTNKILYIGDSIKLDIEPANSIGIKTLLIDRNNFYPNSPYQITSLHQIKSYL